MNAILRLIEFSEEFSEEDDINKGETAETGKQARAELERMTAVIEAARLQNSVWHSPAVTAALAEYDGAK